MKLNRIISIILISLIFFSCEAVITIPGEVISVDTKNGIPAVEIVIFYHGDSLETIYTDQQGKFFYQRLFGAVTGYPEISVEFRKSGYDTLTIDITKRIKAQDYQEGEYVVIELNPIKN